MNREQLHMWLADWEEGFNTHRTRRVNTRSVAEVKMARGATVRQHLLHIVRRTPQVMVRISGGGRGMGAIRAHLNYISRHGQLALEDQDGDHHLGKDDLAWLGYSWQNGGVPVAEQTEWREAVNIVLSMPAGTDAVAVQRAAREFAAGEFAGFAYVMALHTSESDPSRSASAHPHVHLCVKKVAADGRRLNPRKQDLRRWREGFAERLREHGIDVAASHRLERFQPQRGQKQCARHMRARGVALRIEARALPSERWERSRRMVQTMYERYAKVAALLALSEHSEDRVLGADVAAMARPGRERDKDRGGNKDNDGAREREQPRRR